MRVVAGALLCVVILCASSPLHAEVMIERLEWQLAQPVRGRKPVFTTIAGLPTVPPRISGLLRLRVVLKSRGPRRTEGLVLRYSIAARLTSVNSGAEGVWAVPFLISEKRIPKVGPNQYLDVYLDPSLSVDLPLSHYLKRSLATGFWPDQIKAQVMLSPRPGAVESVKTEEIILPVN